MRKKTVNHLADTIFWYLLYFLPVLAYLLYMLSLSSTGVTIVDFGSFFSQIGFSFVSDNIIVSSLADIFGSNGLLPIFANNTPFMIFAWFVCVYLCHLLVDFLLFIPRLAHKFMDKFCKGEE